MLKQITFENWKSLRKTSLYVDPLTLLVGPADSGKSNALEGLLFLSRTARGKNVREAFQGDAMETALRGGIETATFSSLSSSSSSKDQFTVKAWVQGVEKNIEYLYSITVEPVLYLVVAEKLVQIEYYEYHDKPHETVLIDIDIDHDHPVVLHPDLEAKGIVGRIDRMIGLSGLFTALGRFDERLPKKMDIVSRVLKNIFLLNPVPSAMRASSPLSTMLNLDGSNIAGVIAQLPARRKQMVEMKLSSYMAALTGGTLKRMWTETGIGPDAEAMFYGEGQATPGEPSTLIDALEMTDGTLRLLAILTALLTLPTRSLIAIENIGTDLTPSQVCLLLPILHEISEQRSLEVLVTTNDSSILEHLDMESYPLINLLQRHPQSAATMIMLLEEGCMPPDLMDARAMARIVARHAIQRGLVRTRKKRIVARSTVEGHMGG